MTAGQQLPCLSTCKLSPWPAIINACQHWSDSPIEEDEGSQEEDGSNEDEGNDEDNVSEQEHTKDNAPTASAMSDDGLFVFFHDVFYFLFHFSLRLSWYVILLFWYQFFLKFFRFGWYVVLLFWYQFSLHCFFRCCWYVTIYFWCSFFFKITLFFF